MWEGGPDSGHSWHKGGTTAVGMAAVTARTMARATACATVCATACAAADMTADATVDATVCMQQTIVCPHCSSNYLFAAHFAHIALIYDSIILLYVTEIRGCARPAEL